MDPITFNLSTGGLVFQFAWSRRRVFVVHGRDHAVRDAVVNFLVELGVTAIILEQQANRGQTIIEKFENQSKGVSLALALLTPDDIGYPRDRPAEAKSRARQNVFFELGYFVAKMGRKKVVALCDGEVEFPSDLYGVIYIDRTDTQVWQIQLIRELRACGIHVRHL